MKTRYTIKQILTSNGNWWNFYQKHKDRIRENIVVVIVKLLSCRSIIRGRQEYHCPHCQHVKYVLFSCKSRACSSCGKKATELWIQKQHAILPATSWQHITFTMPDDLWDFFWYNRFLLNEIPKIAANCIQTIAKQKGVLPGIFIALHTFGRNLKRNVHIHLSTTLGGLLLNGLGWKKYILTALPSCACGDITLSLCYDKPTKKIASLSLKTFRHSLTTRLLSPISSTRSSKNTGLLIVANPLLITNIM